MLAGFTWFETEKRIVRTLAFERENGFINVVVHTGASLSNLMFGADLPDALTASGGRVMQSEWGIAPISCFDSVLLCLSPVTRCDS